MIDVNNPLSSMSYTNKDFVSIYTELLDLVKVLTNQWDPSISNESDPGVVLTKLNAVIGDKNNYNTDKNVLEVFPATVSQDDNARQLFAQLGYYMKWYLASKIDLSVKLSVSEEDSDASNVSSVTIPMFTMFTNEDNSRVFTTIASKTIVNDEDATLISALEGSVYDFTINGNDKITIDNLDSQNRIYFNDLNIAENGIFIADYVEEGNERTYGLDNRGYGWTRVDNIAVENNSASNYEKHFEFGVLPLNNIPYIEFPDNASYLIGQGIYIKYIKTNGADGNALLGDITRFKDSSIELSITKNDSTSGTLPASKMLNSIVISNLSAGILGKNPEIIDDAYRSYKKTVGTFNTLVSLRDYINAINTKCVEAGIVSNGFVTDRTDDIQNSYYVVDSNQSYYRKNSYSKNIEAFDLKMYLLNYDAQPSISTSNYNKTFSYVKDMKYSKNDLHTFKYPISSSSNIFNVDLYENESNSDILYAELTGDNANKYSLTYTKDTISITLNNAQQSVASLYFNIVINQSTAPTFLAKDKSIDLSVSSPGNLYDVVAGDANNSNSITSADIVAIKKYLGGESNEISNGAYIDVYSDNNTPKAALNSRCIELLKAFFSSLNTDNNEYGVALGLRVIDGSVSSIDLEKFNSYINDSSTTGYNTYKKQPFTFEIDDDDFNNAGISSSSSSIKIIVFGQLQPSGIIDPNALNYIYELPIINETYTISDGTEVDNISNLSSDEEILKQVKNALSENKSIQHDFQSSDINKLLFIKNRYPLSFRVYTQTKVNALVAAEIKLNIQSALRERFNSQRVSFGEEINYDDVYNTILSSDNRIKNVVLDDIEYTAYGVYVDALGNINEIKLNNFTDTESKNLSNIQLDFITEIYAKSILAGNTPLFKPVDNFNYRLSTNGKKIKNVSKIETNTSLVIGDIDNPTPIQENENVIFYADSLIQKANYSTSIYFLYYSGSDNLEYTLNPDEGYTTSTFIRNPFVLNVLINYLSAGSDSIVFTFTSDSTGWTVEAKYSSSSSVIASQSGITLSNFGIENTQTSPYSITVAIDTNGLTSSIASGEAHKLEDNQKIAFFYKVNEDDPYYTVRVFNASSFDNLETYIRPTKFTLYDNTPSDFIDKSFWNSAISEVSENDNIIKTVKDLGGGAVLTGSQAIDVLVPNSVNMLDWNRFTFISNKEVSVDNKTYYQIDFALDSSNPSNKYYYYVLQQDEYLCYLSKSNTELAALGNGTKIILNLENLDYTQTTISLRIEKKEFESSTTILSLGLAAIDNYTWFTQSTQNSKMYTNGFIALGTGDFTSSSAYTFKKLEGVEQEIIVLGKGYSIGTGAPLSSPRNVLTKSPQKYTKDDKLRYDQIDSVSLPTALAQDDRDWTGYIVLNLNTDSQEPQKLVANQNIVVYDDNNTSTIIGSYFVNDVESIQKIQSVDIDKFKSQVQNNLPSIKEVGSFSYTISKSSFRSSVVNYGSLDGVYKLKYKGAPENEITTSNVTISNYDESKFLSMKYYEYSGNVSFSYDSTDSTWDHDPSEFGITISNTPTGDATINVVLYDEWTLYHNDTIITTLRTLANYDAPFDGLDNKLHIDVNIGSATSGLKTDDELYLCLDYLGKYTLISHTTDTSYDLKYNDKYFIDNISLNDYGIILSGSLQEEMIGNIITSQFNILSNIPVIESQSEIEINSNWFYNNGYLIQPENGLEIYYYSDIEKSGDSYNLVALPQGNYVIKTPKANNLSITNGTSVINLVNILTSDTNKYYTLYVPNNITYTVSNYDELNTYIINYDDSVAGSSLVYIDSKKQGIQTKSGNILTIDNIVNKMKELLWYDTDDTLGTNKYNDFDFTYQVFTENLIEYPLDSYSLLNYLHVYNPFTICQINSIYNDTYKTYQLDIPDNPIMTVQR